MSIPVEEGVSQLQLVAFKGLPGTGKSTLARALARELRWPLIDKDDIKDILDGCAAEAGGLAYDTMFNLVRRQTLLGLNVICDSPLTFEHGYMKLREIAAETSAILLIIEPTLTDEQIWRERIEARKVLGLPVHHQTDWEVFQNYRRSVASLVYPLHDPHLIVNTTRPQAVVLKEIMNWLDQEEESGEEIGCVADPCLPTPLLE